MKLIDVRRQYNNAHPDKPLTSTLVAEKAGVPLADEFTMELGRPVTATVARRVLQAFSELTEKPYTIRDVLVEIKQASPEPRFALFGDEEGGATWRG